MARASHQKAESVIRMRMDFTWGLRGLALALALTSCGSTQREEAGDQTNIYTPARSFATAENPFEPLPREIERSPAAKLGEMLYADTIMSADNSLTCFSCHDMAKGGTDGLPKAHVASRQTGQINTGTIFNLAFNFRFNWNGKFVTLLSHINGPLTSQNIMRMSWPVLVERVRRVDSYRRLFRKIYKDGVTAENIQRAVTAYQLSLVTPNAPFDQYLRGKPDALDAEQLSGYALFKTLGCVSCHQGINIGGNLFAEIGIMGDYFDDRQRAGRGDLVDADLGRFLVTQDEEHRHVFRVPSLRNAACTGPYFHDGNMTTLDEAVIAMGRYQLGRELEAEQVHLLVAFLESLTGEHEGQPLCAPHAPSLDK